MITKMGIPVISVVLHEKTVSGTDAFNRTTYITTPVTVEGVNVGSPASDDIVNDQTLSDKKVAYVLAIPSGDTHVWEDSIVEFFGRKWHTVGVATQFIDGFMGGQYPWNKKIKVEAYE